VSREEGALQTAIKNRWRVATPQLGSTVVEQGDGVGCRVRYLNSAGIHAREAPGITELAKSFPEHWLLYASFECWPRGVTTSVEIDAMVVMDDRVLLLELKDWHGELTAGGDLWFVNGRPRGRSAADQVNMKARKVAGLLSSMIHGWSAKYTVDSRVVLTGTATRSNLQAAQQAMVLTLTEAAALGEVGGVSRGLAKTLLVSPKPFTFEAEFERITRSPKHFKPLERLWSGYRVVEEDVVVHPRGLWREHRGERARDDRNKGLIRVWRFDHLSPGLNNPEHRRTVAERESRAIAHLEDQKSTLVPSGVLMPLPDENDEVLTQYAEVRRLSAGWTTLDRFLERTEAQLTLEDRTLTAATLVNAVGELHDQGVAHRDLGARNVWIGGPTQQALTGFMACQIPNEGSVAPWLDELRYYPAPVGDLSARQLDVHAGARLMLQVLHGSTASDPNAAIAGLPQPLQGLRPWFGRAFGLDGETLFQNGRDAADEFGRLLDARDDARIDNSLLDGHETNVMPTSRWPLGDTLRSGTKHVWRSREDGSATSIIVKVWYGWIRHRSRAGDVGLMRLLNGVSRIRQAGRADLPTYVAAGLSAQGAFIAYEEAQGSLWSEASPDETVGDAVAAGMALVRAVEALHLMGLDHGDIAGRNIVHRGGSQDLTIVDLFDFSEVGDGRIVGGDVRPENAEALTAQELDRFAVVRLIRDRIGQPADPLAGPLLAALDLELARDRIELLAPVQKALEAYADQTDPGRRPTISLATSDGGTGPLQTEDTPFFARGQMLRNGNTEFRLFGLQHELVIEVGALGVGAAQVVTPTFKSLSRASQQGVPINVNLVRDPAASGGAEVLVTLLQAQVPVTPLAEPTDGESAKPSVEAPLDVERYWRRIIELEDERQPRVTITGELVRIGDVATYSYERGGVDFDFDPDDQVEVRWPNGGRIGELELGGLDGRSIAVRHRTNRRLTAGDQVILVERRARSSFDRRSRAVERVLADKALIADLMDYFVPENAAPTVDYEIDVTEQDLEPYGLNPGQKAAFRQVARYGPIGLQQGPPGTGKTLFIAAFVHWLITRRGVRNILIASQSHEAVNNAIEALVNFYKKQGGPRPSLLRIGSKGITDKIRPYHSRSLRERYQVRFETAMKNRVAGIASALGIPRALAEDSVDLDRELGVTARRIAALNAADANKGDPPSADERRRNARALEAMSATFREAAVERLGERAASEPTAKVVDMAFQNLLERHPAASPSDLRNLRRIIELATDWSASLTSPHRNFEEFLAKTRTVVAATCVGVGQTKIRIDAQNFDWVIIDEAARCTSGELAIPVQVGQRVLLVGDHLQLKPMIDQPVLDALAAEMDGVSEAALLRSDFERAFTSSYGIANGTTLTEQYRMAPPICDLVSRVFYQPSKVTLVTSKDRKPDAAFDALPAPLDVAAVWVETDSVRDHAERKFEPNPTTLWNPAEVAATMRLLELLSDQGDLMSSLDKGEEAEPIGVICMYSGQKLMMEQAFADRAWDARFRSMIRIDTVDSYQGKENSIIILSLVRSNPKLQRGHVASDNRCNVALSRAKERLFVLGPKAMWGACDPTDPMRKVYDWFATAPKGLRTISASELD
jgi:tRNA A-37 threonylcarbamoyl transferase component Bud32